MGLETAPQSPLGRIDPSMIVPRADPSLNSPSATAAMIDAFRSGQITANEIADRATKHPAMVAAVQNATDPQLVQVRKDREIADASSAQTASESAALSLAQQKELANIPQFIRGQYLELVKANMAPAVDPKKWDDAATNKVVEAFGDLMDYHRETLKAKTLSDSTEKGEIADPEVPGSVRMVSVSKATQKPVDEDARQAVEDWTIQYRDPQTWVKAGKPKVHSDLFAAPGVVTPPYTPGALPQDDPRAPMVLPKGMTAPGAPSQGRLIKSGEEKAATEVQSRAAMMSARVLGADEVLKNLQAKGFNPGSAANWFQDFLMGPLGALKTGDRKAYDAAKGTWIQGLLRLESGAAISSKEQSWYEKTFFPTAFDPPAVQEQKANMRADVEAIAAQMAKTGRLDVPSLLNVKGRAEVLDSVFKAAPQGNSSLQAVRVKRGPGRLDNSDPDHPRIIWDAPAKSSGPYAAPDTLRKPQKVVVEKK